MSGSVSIVWTLPFRSRFMRAMGAGLPGVILIPADELRPPHQPIWRDERSAFSAQIIPTALLWKHPKLNAFQYGNRNAGDLQVYGTEVRAAGEIKGFPVVAAERDVGGRGLPVHDAAKLLALRIEDPDAPCAAAIDVARRIHLHAIGHAGLVAAEIGEHAIALLGETAGRPHLEGAHMPAPGVIDVKHASVGRECNSVGEDDAPAQ